MKLTPDDLARWSAAGVGPRGPTATCRHLTRRDFLAASGLTGAAAAASALLPAAVVAADGDDHRKRVLPRPIPQTIQPGAPFHVEFPVHGNEPATITDFDGVVGRAEIQGTGTGFSAGSKEAGLLFDVDIGFMKGRYVGVDNKVHHATFAFV